MDEHLLKTILNSVKPTTGYCALRKTLDTDTWWIDPVTFSIYISKCREKIHEMSIKSEMGAKFEKNNPALLINKVKVTMHV